MKKISNKEFMYLTFLSMFVRSFYNYKDLFGTGIYSMIYKITGKKENMSFFVNSNEYLSGFTAGILLRNEFSNEPSDTEKIRTVISSTLGAVGDNLAYKNIIPFIVLVFLNKAAVHKMELTSSLLGIIVSLLVLFIVFNFSIRFYGLKKGYYEGLVSLKVFRSRSFKNINRALIYLKYLLSLTLFINLIYFNSDVFKISLIKFYLLPAVLLFSGLKIFRKSLNVEYGVLAFIIIILTISCFF